MRKTLYAGIVCVFMGHFRKVLCYQAKCQSPVAVLLIYAMLSGISPQCSSSEGRFYVMSLILEVLHQNHIKLSGQFDFVLEQKTDNVAQTGAFKEVIKDQTVFVTVNSQGMGMLHFCLGNLMGFTSHKLQIQSWQLNEKKFKGSSFYEAKSCLYR